MDAQQTFVLPGTLLISQELLISDPADTSLSFPN